MKLYCTADEARQVLGPALEDGSISQHDFERIVQFHSSFSTRWFWPLAVGPFPAGVLTWYRHFHQRRPFKPLHLHIYTLIGWGGFGAGVLITFVKLVRGLDDPQAAKMAWTRGEREFLDSKHGNIAETQDFDSSEGFKNNERQTTNVDASREASHTRWDEIRKASFGTPASAWDRIRESHERSRMDKAKQSQPASKDRQTEQAEFDALLEAERKISES